MATLLTVACSRGVVFERWVTPEDADADLIGIARFELAAPRDLRLLAQAGVFA
jgi:hypothetical protein